MLMRRRSDRVRAGRKNISLILLAVVVLMLGAGAGVAWWYTFERPDRTEVESGLPVEIVIPDGASTASIATILAGQGIVTNANRFRLESRRAGADGRLRAGTYDLKTGMPYSEAIAALIEGPAIKYVTVTIPEGYVIEQIARRFEEHAGIPAQEFITLANGGYAEFPREYLRDVYGGKLEGYLFPKTYQVQEGATARDVIEMMLDQFEREIALVDIAAAQARGFSLAEVVTMASMIERETKVAEERALVSSVIHNRLEIGMRLQIDATIEYVLSGNRFRLTNADLQIDSPYNTYRNAGLPPGPIANPGLASLQAACDPAETAYVYYVLTSPDGSHTFTETWEEFLTAKQRSKEVFGQ
ncbi:MAG: endolytic transglycosylase MltG [Clostridiales bacterium]|nr:endolytic transglycosylase MltG [Clostridiales bacterium]